MAHPREDRNVIAPTLPDLEREDAYLDQFDGFDSVDEPEPMGYIFPAGASLASLGYIGAAWANGFGPLAMTTAGAAGGLLGFAAWSYAQNGNENFPAHAAGMAGAVSLAAGQFKTYQRFPRFMPLNMAVFGCIGVWIFSQRLVLGMR